MSDSHPARSIDSSPDGLRSASRELAAINQQVDQQSGQRYWRSLEELAGTPEFEAYLQREFPENASQWNGASRRGFLKLMGASLALAGVTGCDIRQPRETIVPYVHTPERVVPGLPLYFCTACELSGYGVGLVVESRMGRPIKVEGNPRHPASRGATSVFAQAATLDLYDPDRARAPSRNGQLTTLAALRRHLAAVRSGWNDAEDRGLREGRGLRILTPAIGSPTCRRLLSEVRSRWPQAEWYVYEPVVAENIAAGNRMAWGDQTAVTETIYHFDRAGTVLSVGADFLAARETPPGWITDFSEARRVAGRPGDSYVSGEGPEEMLRLYAVAATPTLTAAKADHRLTLSPPKIVDAMLWLARRLNVATADTDRAAPTDRLSAEQIEWLEQCAGDLEKQRDDEKAPLVAAGRQQPALVHALVHAINDALGAVGKTVEPAVASSGFPDGHPWSVAASESLHTLTEEMRGGQVETLVILGGNPAFDAPADIPFAKALKKVPDSVHLSPSANETTDLCRWHVPQSHFLESWGDTRAIDGTVSIIQPLIEPLYASLSPIELLAELIGPDERSERSGNGQPQSSGSETSGSVGNLPVSSGYELVRETWEPPQRRQNGEPPDFEQQWQGWLRRGIVENSAEENGNSPDPTSGDPPSSSQGSSPSGGERQPTLRSDFSEQVAAAIGDAEPSQWSSHQSHFHLLFRPDPTIWDGRFANNGWLQELPKPLTKVTWDNVLLMSLGDSARLDVASGDLVRVGHGRRHVTLPVWVIPGQAEGTLTAFFGYGRRHAGRVATGTGFNVYPLRTRDSMWTADRITVEKLGERYSLASTQHHHLMEDRHIVRSGTLAELKEHPDNPEFVHPGEPPPDASFYPAWPEGEIRWGMTIDLTACTGCTACVIACQAENNIPVVGKEEVQRNREMHWLRVDTYYSGPSKEPASTHHQPVPCMHCELAPCEVVCPVAATTHSDDGLNQMIYNRCVGTRYCSNNCPYKVRRFNFLDYGESFFNEPSETFLPNPEVTVRSRGVMEKCTYCVQRIQSAQATAELDGRKMADGDVVTACQSACPARAIEFGDLSDPHSQVHQMRHHPLNYALLGELNTRPRTTYLAEVKNPADSGAHEDPGRSDG